MTDIPFAERKNSSIAALTCPSLALHYSSCNLPPLTLTLLALDLDLPPLFILFIFASYLALLLSDDSDENNESSLATIPPCPIELSLSLLDIKSKDAEGG